MKVLMINGSPHEKGCTNAALEEIAKALYTDGVDSEIVWLGSSPVQDCIACGGCRKTGRCVFDDSTNTVVEKAAASDGFVFGTPVYYAHPSGRVLSVLDRAFYSGSAAFAGKPGAAIASARRAGTTASFDAMNKYFTIASMPIASSTYWNMVHGMRAEDVAQDAEGLQTMRNIAHSLSWLMKCIALGRESGIELRRERGEYTNFIR